jgi:hypothetical protein
MRKTTALFAVGVASFFFSKKKKKKKKKIAKKQRKKEAKRGKIFSIFTPL